MAECNAQGLPPSDYDSHTGSGSGMPPFRVYKSKGKQRHTHILTNTEKGCFSLHKKTHVRAINTRLKADPALGDCVPVMERRTTRFADTESRTVGRVPPLGNAATHARPHAASKVPSEEFWRNDVGCPSKSSGAMESVQKQQQQQQPHSIAGCPPKEFWRNDDLTACPHTLGLHERVLASERVWHNTAFQRSSDPREPRKGSCGSGGGPELLLTWRFAMRCPVHPLPVHFNSQ